MISLVLARIALNPRDGLLKVEISATAHIQIHKRSFPNQEYDIDQNLFVGWHLPLQLLDGLWYCWRVNILESHRIGRDIGDKTLDSRRSADTDCLWITKK